MKKELVLVTMALAATGCGAKSTFEAGKGKELRTAKDWGLNGYAHTWTPCFGDLMDNLNPDVVCVKSIDFPLNSKGLIDIGSLAGQDPENVKGLLGDMVRPQDEKDDFVQGLGIAGVVGGLFTFWALSKGHESRKNKNHREQSSSGLDKRMQQSEQLANQVLSKVDAKLEKGREEVSVNMVSGAESDIYTVGKPGKGASVPVQKEGVPMGWGIFGRHQAVEVAKGIRGDSNTSSFMESLGLLEAALDDPNLVGEARVRVQSKYDRMRY